MSLDYNGYISSFERKRDLTLGKIDRRDVDTVLDSPGRQPVSDTIFDNVARLYLKGEALLDALGEMAPAGFIPVEAESSVISSIQRLRPEGPYNEISFGFFKEACEHIANRATALDEDFVLNFTAIDPNLESSTVTKTYKEVSDSGDDWISQFLIGASSFAGMMLAGYIGDVFGSNAPRATGPDNEPKQWFLQGLPVGVSLLIELGLTYAALKTLYGDSATLNPDVDNKFVELTNNPQLRREILEGAGYDYDALQGNQKFNDYKAVKEYALTYISRHQEVANYDHWIGWLQTLESQMMVRHAFAMAPTFSTKWERLYESGSFQPEEEEVDLFSVQYPEDTESDEFSIKDALTAPLKNYLSTMLTVTNPVYDKLYSTYNFELDERTLCCLIYFLGPMDGTALQRLADVLKLGTFHLSIDIKNILAFITDSALSALLSMLTSYLNKLIQGLLNNIFEALFSIPESDLEAFIKLCVGIDWIFAILDEIISATIEQLQKVIDSLAFAIESITNKAGFGCEIAVDRKVIITIAALLEAIADKIDEVGEICQLTKDKDDVVTFDNEAAAAAAVEFVSVSLPEMYPIMDMPEENRRKYFSNVPGFETRRLGIQVQPSDERGIINPPTTIEEAAIDCGANMRAAQSLILGRKFSEALKNI